MTLFEIAEWIEETSIGTALRESQYAFPLVEAGHLLGLALSFGLVLLTDLRLTGLLLRSVPLTDLLHQLRPWIFSGFALTFVTGGLLFWSEATVLVDNAPFWFKVACMVIACLNALYFELRWGRYAERWAAGPVIPLAARRAGWISLTFWTLATIFGRIIPYY